MRDATGDSRGHSPSSHVEGPDEKSDGDRCPVARGGACDVSVWHKEGKLLE